MQMHINPSPTVITTDFRGIEKSLLSEFETYITDKRYVPTNIHIWLYIYMYLIVNT